MEDLKGFLARMIFRWLLKIAGGYFAINGALSPDLNNALLQVAGGLSAIIVGVIISLSQHKKAINQVAPAN